METQEKAGNGTLKLLAIVFLGALLASTLIAWASEYVRRKRMAAWQAGKGTRWPFKNNGVGTAPAVAAPAGSVAASN